MALDQYNPGPDATDPANQLLNRQDDVVPRATWMTVGVNPPDEVEARWIAWLRQNGIYTTADAAASLLLLNELLTDYALHRASAVYHNPADTTNTVPTTVVTAIGVAIIRANQLKVALRAHFLNAGGSYHDVTDTVNETALGLVPDATDTASLRTLLIAEKLYFNDHRTQPGVHVADDVTNVVVAADPGAPSLQGPLGVNGDLDVDGDITATGSISAGTELAGDTLDITTDAAIGNDLTVGGSVVGGLDVTGSVTVSVDLEVGGEIDVQGLGQSNIGGVLAVGVGIETAELLVTNDATVTGVLRTAGPVYLPDADVTIDSATGSNRVIFPTPAANRVVTLRQSTAPIPVEDDWFEVTVILGASVFTTVLQREGSGDFVAVLGNSNDPFATGNYVASARVQVVAGVWRLMSVGGAKAFRGADS